MIDGEGEWLGFVQAIQKLFKQSDRTSKARFNLSNKIINDEAVKTSRLVKNMKGDI